MQVQAANLLKHLGVIKNELLIFAVLAVLITNGFGRSLLMGNPDQFTKVISYLMHLSTIPMLFGVGGFYAYASLKLPSSKQEMMFERSAEKALEAHEKTLEAKNEKSLEAKTD